MTIRLSGLQAYRDGHRLAARERERRRYRVARLTLKLQPEAAAKCRRSRYEFSAACQNAGIDASQAYPELMA